MPYVSRAGEKIEGALEHFKIDPTGLTCLDVGSSTGGFTDCLLQRGATHVYAVDTGYGLLDWKLRNDPRVTVLERTNILHDIPELEAAKDTIELAVADTSWTRLQKSVPATFRFLAKGGRLLALIKPHYQAQPHDLKKGILPDEKSEPVAQRVCKDLRVMNYQVSELYESPIRGGKGNREFWVLIDGRP